MKFKYQSQYLVWYPHRFILALSVFQANADKKMNVMILIGRVER